MPTLRQERAAVPELGSVCRDEALPLPVALLWRLPPPLAPDDAVAFAACPLRTVLHEPARETPAVASVASCPEAGGEERGGNGAE